MVKRFTNEIQAIHFVERNEDITVDTTIGRVYIPHDHLDQDVLAAVDYLVNKVGYYPVSSAFTPWEPETDV